mmetsp:Transcript_59864/g.88862  ORF Transcript_59864/g.88862 Transcript_59864/m.88862 type:complete len:131 (+) Transcript_59864:123-515(+)
MNINGGENTIRDVALGWDHTVVLSSNQRDVYVFGKGGDGQLGLSGKPFVSAPAKSVELSSKNTSSKHNSESSSNSDKIAAVCAIRHCSLTLNEKGDILKQVGQCRKLHTMEEMRKSLDGCAMRAKRNGLL